MGKGVLWWSHSSPMPLPVVVPFLFGGPRLVPNNPQLPWPELFRLFMCLTLVLSLGPRFTIRAQHLTPTLTDSGVFQVGKHTE